MKPKSYDQHEIDIARLLGGRKTCSSGRYFHDKSDGKSGRPSEDGALQWDCKSTHAATYRLTGKTWFKLELEAAMTSRTPVMPIRFLDVNDNVLSDMIVVQENRSRPTEDINRLVQHGVSVSIKPEQESKQLYLDTPLRMVRLRLMPLDDFLEGRDV
jgi:hypothetical protein